MAPQHRNPYPAPHHADGHYAQQHPPVYQAPYPGTNGHAQPPAPPAHYAYGNGSAPLGYEHDYVERNGHGRAPMDVEDPVTLRNYRLADFDDPVRIPMRRFDWAFPFVLFAFAAIIACFWITVKNMDVRDRAGRMRFDSPALHKISAPASRGAE